MDGGDFKYDPLLFEMALLPKLSQLDVTEICVQIKDESLVGPCGYPNSFNFSTYTIRNNVMCGSKIMLSLLNVFSSFRRKACGNL